MIFSIPQISQYLVLAQKVNVWHPQGDDEGYTISSPHCGWLEGVYDSESSALMGALLSLSMNEEFFQIQVEVNHVDKQGRLLTTQDLSHLIEKCKCPHPYNKLESKI